MRLTIFCIITSLAACSSVATHNDTTSVSDTNEIPNQDLQAVIDRPPPSTPLGDIELLGEWKVENPIPNNPNAPLQDQTLLITQEMWGQSPLAYWNNMENFAVIQSPPNDPFYAGLYHRVVWTDPMNQILFTCQVAQGLESIEQAKNFAKRANNQDFEHGCNGFPWQRLVRISD